MVVKQQIGKHGLTHGKVDNIEVVKVFIYLLENFKRHYLGVVTSLVTNDDVALHRLRWLVELLHCAVLSLIFTGAMLLA